MNKKEFIEAVVAKTGFTKKDTEATLNAIFDTIIEGVADGAKIQFVGFGTFESVERAEREGRNPQTGEAMTIKASKAPKFKAGKAFKEAVNA